jgi:hypothetical protein
MALYSLLFLLGCSGQKEENVNPVLTDLDGDGFSSASDCDDGDASVHPDAEEICDGVDNDCDGLLDAEDDSAVLDSYFPDADGDGFGAGEALAACEQPSAHVLSSSDCDDGDASVHPDADELCDGTDNDCDGLTDDDDESTSNGTESFPDLDSDGFGDGSAGRAFCQAPDGWLSDSSDCDDADALIHPNALEICDGMDNDCNGFTDEADDDLDLASAPLWYLDLDGDGDGDESTGLEGCLPPEGYVGSATDCDDSSSVFNGMDYDGDGQSSCAGDCDDADSLNASCGSCTQQSLYPWLGASVLTASIDGASSVLESGCGAGPSASYLWSAPFDGVFSFEIVSDFSAYLSISASCGEPEDECQAGAILSRAFQAGESAVLLVGAVETDAAGSYTLSVASSEENDCSDGMDEDLDGMTDCDDAGDCWYDEACSLGQCPDFDLIDTQTFLPADGADLFTGHLEQASDDYQGSCMSGSGPDYSYFYEALSTGCLLATAYSDSMELGLFHWSECAGEELQCSDSYPLAEESYGVQHGAYLALDVQAGQDYILVVDGGASPAGTFSMELDLDTEVDCTGAALE